MVETGVCVLVGQEKTRTQMVETGDCVLVQEEKTRTQMVETGVCVLVGCLESVCERSDWVRGGCFAQF